MGPRLRLRRFCLERGSNSGHDEGEYDKLTNGTEGYIDGKLLNKLK